MFSLFFGKKPATARINGKPISVKPKDTILLAALREGIEFPHSCRVGGCAKCKCRLVDGKVKRLTQFGYVLSEEEIKDGVILACQSVPVGDVSVEVDVENAAKAQSVSGTVVEQAQLTHDIARLRIQLAQPLHFRPGQFATLELADLPGVRRSYSFASPVSPDGQISFFVRKLPGGRFSGFVHERNLVGRSIAVDGPHGDFWLRESDRPLLMVAGGSGLAPILAMLEQSIESQPNRSVTVLFGARTQRDIYCRQELARIANRWSGHFKHVTVLSAEPEGSDWQGVRGMLADVVGAYCVPQCEAYLCGPPPMVDSVLAALAACGITPQDIRIDRFATEHVEAVPV
ncbi:oxidoreductase [Aquabacterium sp. NJ1]|uniref:2Fe-2S iron-sulfur cluster-binding protein n=1 Tax=Aquabacterium sp. NJ1 TaxID=1538295 RepID=UPI00052BAE5D|nr:2Fe-2S iron-sulfur cluster binding domain-containing protein [Aquabacterium sp. NJ1]KGM39794.1 oxidoreductase [Aquabacterium sp. NJ1]